jgi:hypothetical protein
MYQVKIQTRDGVVPCGPPLVSATLAGRAVGLLRCAFMLLRCDWVVGVEEIDNKPA